MILSTAPGAQYTGEWERVPGQAIDNGDDMSASAVQFQRSLQKPLFSSAVCGSDGERETRL